MQSDRFFPVQINRSVERRRLDQRLIGLNEVFGPPPVSGWVRAVRRALGMSTFDLARRIGLSDSRVKQLEQAEAAGSIRLSQLRRLAGALNCEFHYVILPRESLEKMVRRQARLKAAEKIASTGPLDCQGDDSTLVIEAMSEEFQALVHDLIDRRGLWK
jgi:predicted DNA-binding mobile mystery protein A